MMKLEKQLILSANRQVEQAIELQDTLDEEGFIVTNKRFPSKTDILMDSDIEITPKSPLESQQWWLRTTEAEYLNLIRITADGATLCDKDIVFLLKGLLPSEGFFANLRALGHDYTWPKIMGSWWGCEHAKKTTLPDMWREWSLQALSYVIENGQLRTVQRLVQHQPIAKDTTFLIDQFFELLDKDVLVLKRIAAISLSHLLPNKGAAFANKTDKICDVLLETLSATASLTDTHIHASFKLEKETNIFSNRIRASQALKTLARKKYSIPEKVFAFSLKLIEPIEQQAEAYLGNYSIKRIAPVIGNGSSVQWYSTYEKDALNKHLFTTGEFFYIYKYIIENENENCMKALFYAASVNGQAVSAGEGKQTLSKVIEKCTALVEAEKESGIEKAWLAACILCTLAGTSEASLQKSIHILLKRMNIALGRESLVHSQCTIAVAYALKVHPKAMKKHCTAINQSFDSLRANILDFQSKYVVNNQQNRSALQLLAGAQKNIQALISNTTGAISTGALNLFRYLSHGPNLRYDAAFQKSLVAKFQVKETLETSLDIVLDMLKNQEAESENNINSELFEGLIRLLRQDNLEITHQRKISFILGKLFQNNVEFNVNFPVQNLPIEVIKILFNTTLVEKEDDSAIFSLLQLSEKTLISPHFECHIDFIVDRWGSLVKILLDEDNQYSNTIKESVIKFIFNLVKIKKDQLSNIEAQLNILINHLLLLIKKDGFLIEILRILEIVASHAESLIFSPALFSELITQLTKTEPQIANNIQALFRIYLKNHQSPKMPEECIKRLGELLSKESFFLYSRSILNDLIIKYNEKVAVDTISTFIHAAASDRDDVSQFSSQLLLKHWQILNEELLLEIKTIAIAAYQNGMFRTAVLLLETIMLALINNPNFYADIADTGLDEIISKMTTESILPADNRKNVYHYFSLCSPNVIVPLTLVKEAIRDLQFGSEELIDASIVFLKSTLYGLSQNVEQHASELEKIIESLSVCLHRKVLISPILEMISQFLGTSACAKMLVSNVPTIINICVSLQYDSESKESEREISFKILNQWEEEKLSAAHKELLLLECEARQLLDAALYDQTFIYKVCEHAERGLLISFSVLRYVILQANNAQKMEETYEPLVNTLIAVAKNGQSVLQGSEQFLKYCLNHQIAESKVLQIILHSMSHEFLLEDNLFDCIQKQFQEEISVDCLTQTMQVLKKQAIRGKEISDKTKNKLLHVLENSNQNSDSELILLAVFILSICLSDSEVPSHDVDKKRIAQTLIYLLIENKQQDVHKRLAKVLQSLSQNLYKDYAAYFKFKTITLHNVNDATFLEDIKIALSPIDSAYFNQQPEMKSDVLSLIDNILFKQVVDSRSIKAITTILRHAQGISQNYFPCKEIMHRLYMFTLDDPRLTDIEDILLFINQFLLSNVQKIEVFDDFSNILKCLIRATNEPTILANALDLFQIINDKTKEYDTTLSDDALISTIKNDFSREIHSNWLSCQLYENSGHKISVQQDYYRKHIHQIIVTAESIGFDLKILQQYFQNGLSQQDFFSLVQLFQIFNDQNELDIPGCALIIDFIKNNYQENHMQLCISGLLKVSEALVVLYQCGLLKNRGKFTNEILEINLLLLSQGWHYDILIKIGQSLRSNNILEYQKIFTNYFRLMVSYKIHPEEGGHLIAMLSDQHSSKAVENLHDFFITQHFNKEFSQEKSIIELIDEFTLNNKVNNEEHESLKKFIEAVKSPDEKFFEDIFDRSLEYWRETEFKKWAISIQQGIQYTLVDILSVVNHAVKLFTSRKKSSENHHVAGFDLRSAQLLAIKYLLDDHSHSLSELATGEGKSIIIAVVSLIKTLQGHTVDVVVSSPLLAERDAVYFKDFFSLFGKSSAHNHTDSDELPINEISPCYEADIVYGEISQFQFDLLKQEFKKQGLRGKRELDYVIVDEADNVMLDQATNIAKLAESIPAFDHMEFMFILIWDYLNKILATFQAKNPLKYFEELKEETLSYIQKKLSANECAGNKILFPEHLQEYIQSQIPKWVNSAIYVIFNTENERDYVLRSDDNGIKHIAPVDYKCTGVTLLNTQWTDGVHQFLQLKEGLKLSPESLTTNYLSNYTFLKRYHRLVGLTGTLGNSYTQHKLCELYSSDSIENPVEMKCRLFPGHKHKQFVQYHHQMLDEKQAWLERIQESVQREVQFGRSVIVICEEIQDIALIHSILLKANSNYKITELKRSDLDVFDNESFLFDSGQIFLTTHLGGRGLDPKPTINVNNKGGIHMIVSSLSTSKRVFDQAIGRTARTGNPGTAELIIDCSALDENLSSTTTLSELEAYRDKKEQESIEELQKELSEILIQDQLFCLFSKLLQEVQDDLEKIVYKKNIQWLHVAYRQLHTIQKEAKLAAVIERWGLWLKQIDPKLEKSILLKQFEDFSAQIKEDQKNDCLIKNPCYLLQIANRIIKYLNGWKHTLTQFGCYHDDCHHAIIECCDEKRLVDPLFTAQAHALKAYAILTYGKKGANGQASLQFKAAATGLQNVNIPQLMAQQLILNSINSQCDFSDQITDKISILSTFLRVYQKGASEIDHARKLVDLKVGEIFTSKITWQNCRDKLQDYPDNTMVSLRFHGLRMAYDVNLFVRNDPLRLIAEVAKVSNNEFDINMIFGSEASACYGRIFQKLSEQTVLPDIQVQLIRKSGVITKLSHALLKDEKDIAEITSVTIVLSNQETAKKIIELLYIYTADAMIEVNLLKKAQAITVLNNIALQEESFNRSNVRDISTAFSNPKQYSDVHQFMANGFYYFFELKERSPLKVYTLAILGSVALVEIAVGTVLVIYAAPSIFGLGVGIGLIADGISEGFDMIKVGVTNEHNWVHYAIQKAVSIGLILGTAGISSAMYSQSTKAASVASKTGSAVVDASDDVARTVNTMVSKFWAKTATHETLKAVTTTVVNKVVSTSLSAIEGAMTPFMYEEFQKKVSKNVEEAVNNIMLNQHTKIRQLFVCAEYMEMSQWIFRVKREIVLILQKWMSLQFTSLKGQLQSMQLLQESFIVDIAKGCTTQLLAYIDSHEEINVKKIIYKHFEKTCRHVGDNERDTEAVVGLLTKSGVINHSFHFNENVDFNAIEWGQYSSHRKELTDIFLRLHLAIYASSQAILKEEKASIFSKKVTADLKNFADTLYEAMTKVISEEVNKVINKVVSGISSAIKILPGFGMASSEIFSPKSLGSAETWKSASQIFDGRRLDGVVHTLSKHLIHVVDQMTTTENHIHHSHSSWLMVASALSISRMQHINEQGMHEHSSVDEQLSSMANSQQEDYMITQLGVSFADQDPLAIKSFRFLMTEGLSEIFRILKMNDAEIQLLGKNTIEEYFEKIVILSDFSSAIFNLLRGKEFHLSSIWKYLIGQVDFTLFPEQAKILELLMYEGFWQCLQNNADQIPALPAQLQRKLALFSYSTKAELIRRESEQSDGYLFGDTLNLICSILKSKECVSFIKKILDYRHQNLSKLYFVFDLLSTRIDNEMLASRFTALIYQRTADLYDRIVKEHKTLLDARLNKLSMPDCDDYDSWLKVIKLEKEGIFQIISILLSLFNPNKFPDLYSHLICATKAYEQNKMMTVAFQVYHAIFDNPLLYEKCCYSLFFPSLRMMDQLTKNKVLMAIYFLLFCEWYFKKSDTYLEKLVSFSVTALVIMLVDAAIYPKNKKNQSSSKSTITTMLARCGFWGTAIQNDDNRLARKPAKLG